MSTTTQWFINRARVFVGTLIISTVCNGAPIVSNNPGCDEQVKEITNSGRASCYGLDEKSLYYAPSFDNQLSIKVRDSGVEYYNFEADKWSPYGNGKEFRLAAQIFTTCDAQCICGVQTYPISSQTAPFCSYPDRIIVPTEGVAREPYLSSCRSVFSEKLEEEPTAAYVVQERETANGKTIFSYTSKKWDSIKNGYSYETFQSRYVDDLVQIARDRIFTQCNADVRYEMLEKYKSAYCSSVCKTKLNLDREVWDRVNSDLTRKRSMSCEKTSLKPIQPPPLGCEQNNKLTIVVTGSGRVYDAANASNCTDTCAINSREVSSRFLQAIPAFGNKFIGWKGSVCDGSTSLFCRAPVEGNQMITAQFGKLPHIVISNGTGGKAMIIKGYLSRTATGYDGYAELGTTIQVAAFSDPNYKFLGWSGVCTGMGMCTFVVKGDAELTLNFGK